MISIATMFAGVTNGAIVIHTQRLKSDPGGNLLS
ncbi:methyl-accepting chemotaxis protein II [Yersinia pestis biovar Orientalis str. F1991016]|nr:methyl-accepting chemotaxis protein II [Yersinia pestis biovar Orientalis str. F1991016]